MKKADFPYYLWRFGVSVIVVDAVTERVANLHAELFELLRLTGAPIWRSAPELYVVAYRAVPSNRDGRLEAWPQPLRVGYELPIVPLWLDRELCVPVQLEEIYLVTCDSLRIHL